MTRPKYSQLLQALSPATNPAELRRLLALLHQEAQQGSLPSEEIGPALETLYQQTTDPALGADIKRLQNRLRLRAIPGRDLLRLTKPPLADAEQAALWHDLQNLKSSYENVQPGQGTFETRYEIFEMIGQGGMSVVYRARRRQDNAEVAIKYLRAEFFANPRITARFARECRLTKSLTDPHIVQVYEAGEQPGKGGFLVMEYLPLGGMDQRLQDEDLSAFMALSVAHQTALALAAAHEREVVHRDVKPANVLIAQWQPEQNLVRVKLTDFGLCKELTGDGFTRADAQMGTDYYVAPEQIAAPGGVDQRADIYSLGVVLYRLLTRKYFPIGDYPRAGQVNPDLPEGVDILLDECLRQEPERRRDSARQIALELAAYMKEMEALN